MSKNNTKQKTKATGPTAPTAPMDPNSNIGPMSPTDPNSVSSPAPVKESSKKPIDIEISATQIRSIDEASSSFPSSILESYCLEYQTEEDWKRVCKIINLNNYQDRHFVIETVLSKSHPWSLQISKTSPVSSIALSVNGISGAPIILKAGRRYFITFINHSVKKGQSTQEEDFFRHLQISNDLFMSSPDSNAPGFGTVRPQTTVSFIAKYPGSYYYCLTERILTGGPFIIMPDFEEINGYLPPNSQHSQQNDSQSKLSKTSVVNQLEFSDEAELNDAKSNKEDPKQSIKPELGLGLKPGPSPKQDLINIKKHSGDAINPGVNTDKTNTPINNSKPNGRRKKGNRPK